MDKWKIFVENKYLPSFPANIIVVLTACAAIVNYPDFAAINTLRYIIYFIPILIALCWVMFPASRAEGQAAGGFLVLALFGALALPAVLGGYSGLQYLVFMGVGLIPYAFPVRLPPRSIWFFFAILCIAQIAFSLRSGTLLSRFNVESLQQGSAASTNTLPGLFGIFLPFTLQRRRVLGISIGILMIIVAAKRSVLASCFVGVGFYAVLYRGWTPEQRLLFSGRALAISAIVVVSGMSICYRLPQVYQYIAQRYDLNIDVFTSGRYRGQQLAYGALTDGDIFNRLLGYGLGKADGLAVIGFAGDTNLIHSDYLRLLIDFGPILGIIFGIIYLLLISRNKIGPFFVGFSGYIWFTENNLVNAMIPIVMFLVSSPLLRGAVTSSKPQQR